MFVFSRWGCSSREREKGIDSPRPGSEEQACTQPRGDRVWALNRTPDTLKGGGRVRLAS